MTLQQLFETPSIQASANPNHREYLIIHIKYQLNLRLNRSIPVHRSTASELRPYKVTCGFPFAMTTEAKPDEIWYDANCHCAAVKCRIKMAPIETQQVTNDNCSICTKNGYLNVFVKKNNLEFLRGKETLKDYHFGNKKFAHKFCPTCGSSLFVDPGSETMVVNVRLFDCSNNDLGQLTVIRYA